MSEDAQSAKPLSACEKVMRDLHQLRLRNNDFEGYANAFLNLQMQLRTLGEPLSLNWQKFFLFAGLDGRADRAKLEGQKQSVSIYQILANLQPIYQQNGVTNTVPIRPATQPVSPFKVADMSKATKPSENTPKAIDASKATSVLKSASTFKMTNMSKTNKPSNVNTQVGLRAMLDHHFATSKIEQRPGRALKVSWKKVEQAESSSTDRVEPNHQEPKKSSTRVAGRKHQLKQKEHLSATRKKTKKLNKASQDSTKVDQQDGQETGKQVDKQAGQPLVQQVDKQIGQQVDEPINKQVDKTIDQQPVANGTTATTSEENGAARTRGTCDPIIESGKDEPRTSSRKPKNDEGNLKVFLESPAGYVYEQFCPRNTVSRSGRVIKPKGAPA